MMWNRMSPTGGGRADENMLRTLLVGAGAAGRTLARDLKTVRDFRLLPIGFLDDDVHKRIVSNLPVFGPTTAVRDVVERARVDVVVVAIPGLPTSRLKAIVDAASAGGVEVRVLPSFLAAVERGARVQDLVGVDLVTLLGRTERDVGSAAARSV